MTPIAGLDVRPALSPLNVANQVLVCPEFARQRAASFARSETPSDFKDLCFGDGSAWVPLASNVLATESFERMADVRASRNHFKVLDSVVALVAVDVVDCEALRHRPKKRISNEAMDLLRVALGIYAKVLANVSLFIDARSQYLPDDGGSSLGGWTPDSLYSSLGRNRVVSLKTNDWQPCFMHVSDHKALAVQK